MRPRAAIQNTRPELKPRLHDLRKALLPKSDSGDAETNLVVEILPFYAEWS